MEFRGKLLKKTNDRSGVAQNGTEWHRAEFLIEDTSGRFVRRMVFSVQDRDGRIARFEALVGKHVEVSFDIDAREWQNRYFNDIEAWGILNLEDQKQEAAPAAPALQGDPLPFEQ